VKTVFHANVDGREIVLGFGEAHGFIDPEATWRKVEAILAETDESKQMHALNAQINAVRAKASEALATAAKFEPVILPDGKVLSAGNPQLMARYNGEYQMHLGEAEELVKQLTPLVTAFEARRSALFLQQAEYTHPPQGEDLISDDAAASLQAKHAARGDGRALLMSGEYITDLRGREYWLPNPWRKASVAKLGDELPKGAVLTPTADQSQEIASQQEADRVAALDPDQRTAEAQAAQVAAQQEAAALRARLEITGDAKALAKAQASYADAVEAIEEKYGVSLS